jgi:hypothetical protein
MKKGRFGQLGAEGAVLLFEIRGSDAILYV